VSGSQGPFDSGLYVLDTTTHSVVKLNDDTLATASFAPRLPDRLVYSATTAAAAGIFTVRPDGGDLRRLTGDGTSTAPVWGPDEIAFARSGTGPEPGTQIWVMRPDGSQQAELTHSTSVLVPAAWAARGHELLANSQTTQGWQTSPRLVSLHTGRVTRLRVGHLLDGDVRLNGVSRDGRRVLITYPPSNRMPSINLIGTVPITGGRPTALVANAFDASWNG